MAPITTERMDLRKLQRIVIDALEDIKGQDIRVYDTTAITDLFDRVVLVSGTSNRQTRSMAAHVRDKVKKAGGDVISVEGEQTGEWVLVDLADIVVHVMQPAIRAYYNLEELWGSKPVRVKLGEAAGPAYAQASEDMGNEAPALSRAARAAKPRAAKAGGARAEPAKPAGASTGRPPRGGAANAVGTAAGASKAGGAKPRTSKAGAPSRGPARPASPKSAAKPAAKRTRGPSSAN